MRVDPSWGGRRGELETGAGPAGPQATPHSPWPGQDAPARARMPPSWPAQSPAEQVCAPAGKERPRRQPTEPALRGLLPPRRPVGRRASPKEPRRLRAPQPTLCRDPGPGSGASRRPRRPLPSRRSVPVPARRHRPRGLYLRPTAAGRRARASKMPCSPHRRAARADSAPATETSTGGRPRARNGSRPAAPRKGSAGCGGGRGQPARHPPRPRRPPPLSMRGAAGSGAEPARMRGTGTHARSRPRSSCAGTASRSLGTQGAGVGARGPFPEVKCAPVFERKTR